MKEVVLILLTVLLFPHFGNSYVAIPSTTDDNTTTTEEYTTKTTEDYTTKKHKWGDRCSDGICLPHQKCVEMKVYCFVAPCYPILQCHDLENTPVKLNASTLFVDDDEPKTKIRKQK